MIAVLSFMSQYISRLPNENNPQINIFYQFLINIPGYVLISIIDYSIINTIHKRLKRHNNIIRIALNLILTSLCAIALVLLSNHILLMFVPYKYDAVRTTIPLVFWNCIVVLLLEIFLYHQRQSEAEKRLTLAEKEKIQYQYERLKAQINPHFLFNSLNVLSSLTYQDTRKANLFAKKMSGVYRYLLMTNEHPVVTLKEELSFLESYLYLEQIRFEDALFVEIRKDDSVLNKKVIPVSIQLLVENALKHNITTSSQPLHILIDITDHEITVTNNLQLRYSVVKSGLGLMNLQKQYALFDKTISMKQTEKEFIVTIPFIG